MPAELDIWIGAVVTRGNQCYAIFNELMNHANALGDQLTAHNWEGAATQAYLLGNDFNDLRDYGHFRRIMGQYYNAIALQWISDNWPENGGGGEPYELTATKICEAWAKDGFEDRALTIAYIDRMRQLIWDEPFRVQWAARPE